MKDVYPPGQEPGQHPGYDVGIRPTNIVVNDERFHLNEEGRVAIKPEFFPNQGADGHAHVAYFDVRTQASFIWDGKSDAIQVCIGGYGEPVDHEIPSRVAFVHDTSGQRWIGDETNPGPEGIVNLEWFNLVCKAHADTLETY